MIKEVDREVALRKKWYPQWVQTGKIKQVDANYRIEVMQWIAEDFQQKIKEVLK
jgi:hypothetical protein